MTAAIWSTPPGDCLLDFPARTLVRPTVGPLLPIFH